MRIFFNYKIFLIIFLVAFLWLPFSIQASSLVHISDTISTSAPSKGSNHTIKFFNPSFIPASGKIVITPEDNEFNIPTDFDYSDVDLAVSPSTIENYVDRNLSSSTDSSFDGVAVNSGTSSSIVITMNSTSGINAGDNVLIKLGNNAVFGDNGDKQIINPSENGAYKITIATYDNSDNLLDNSTVLVAIVNEVIVNTAIGKTRSNGRPRITDILTNESTITIVSLMTNYRAQCRYAHSLNGDSPNASTTSFYDMTDIFTNTGAFYHSMFIENLPYGYHEYYVLCMDTNGEIDATPYLINFHKSSPGEGDSGTGGGSGSGSGGTGSGSGGSSEGNGTSGSGGGGGGSGGGKGPNYGPSKTDLQLYPPLLVQPDLTLKGWAFPNAKVTILKDGKQEKIIDANANGEFSFDFFSMTKGVYTFGVTAKDTDSRQSETYNSTIWLNEGAKTTISQIFIPASMSIKNNSVALNEKIEVSGQSVLGSKVEVSLYPSAGNTEPSPDKIIKQEILVASDGKWQATIDTKGLKAGVYKVRARTNLPTIGYSNYNKPQDVGIGVSLKKTGVRSDLNFDGKVNLADFSILLYYWNSNNAIADINTDGKVNLIDFGIMMYDWTG